MAGKRDKKQIRDILTLIEQFDADVAEIASRKEQRQADAAEAAKNGTLGELVDRYFG